MHFTGHNSCKWFIFGNILDRTITVFDEIGRVLEYYLLYTQILPSPPHDVCVCDIQ